MMYVGIVAPEVFYQDFTPGGSGLDLSTVSAATIEIRKPDGTTTSWSTTLSNQSATTLRLTHSLSAAPSEIDQAGTWNLYAKFTVPGGYRRSEHWEEQVLPQHG